LTGVFLITAAGQNREMTYFTSHRVFYRSFFIPLFMTTAWPFTCFPERHGYRTYESHCVPRRP
jgi:hypothetical protein